MISLENSLKGFSEYITQKLKEIAYDIEMTKDDREKVYRSSKLLKKIINKPVTSALKNFLDYGDNTKLQDIHELHGIKKQLFSVAIEGRKHGNILIVYNDGRVPDLAPTRDFKSLLIYTDEAINWIEEDEGTVNYRRIPEVEVVVNGETEAYQIHKDRWVYLEQDSELETVYPYATSLDTAIQTPVQLIERSEADLLKLDGLADSLSMCDGEEECKKVYESLFNRIQVMYQLMNSFRLMPIDKEEEFEKLTKDLGGYKEIQDALMVILSAVSEIPATVLYGKSPAGFTSGEHEMENYYDYIASEVQDRFFTPVLEMYHKNIGVKYKIVYDDIKTLGESDRIDLQKKKADTIKVRADIVSTLLMSLSGEISDEDILKFVMTGEEIQNIEDNSIDPSELEVE